MKFGILAFLSLISSCVPRFFEADSENFDADTVHIADNYHVKLIKFEKGQLEAFAMNRDPVRVAPEKDYSKGIHAFGVHSIDLGMKSVPVLDQGQYGTCVTFSSTAALGAILDSGDFISQQCSLELDKALGNNVWNGAYAPSEVIVPLQKYGVVEKSLCPEQYANVAASISIPNYQALADADNSEVIANVEYEYTPKADLVALKAALGREHRVLIGFLVKNIPEAVRGFNIKVDGISYSGGLWACSQSIWTNYCGSSNAGHEVVVIGYDDDQELLKIRNSWNTVVGEEGNYYMTYKFFESQVIDMTEVW